MQLANLIVSSLALVVSTTTLAALVIGSRKMKREMEYQIHVTKQNANGVVDTIRNAFSEVKF